MKVKERGGIYYEKSKRFISLLAAMAVMFCTAAVFSGVVSAMVDKKGTEPSVTYTSGGKTFGGSVSASAVTAKTTFSTTAGLTAHAMVDYRIGGTAGATYSIGSPVSNASTSVSAPVSYTGVLLGGYGGHDASYASMYLPHLSTKLK